MNSSNRFVRLVAISGLTPAEETSDSADKEAGTEEGNGDNE